jgi:DnaK suppressor protein
MDRTQQEAFRPRIDARLLEIDEELAMLEQDTRAIEPDTAIGRLSRYDSMQMQSIALDARQRLRDEHVRLREALKRIGAGTYGLCLRCERDIPMARLEAQPDAVVCVDCSRR